MIVRRAIHEKGSESPLHTAMFEREVVPLAACPPVIPARRPQRVRTGGRAASGTVLDPRCDQTLASHSAPQGRLESLPHGVRPAYTLLEMTLALAIALVILGGVYEFLNRQLYLAEIGRDLVEESSLARVILDRMAADIAASLGGLDPQQLPDVSSDSTEALLQAETFTPLFNKGIDGSSNSLMISASRVPRELLASDKRRLASDSLPKVSDLRRISYWFVDDGDAGGLARQELAGVTSSDFDVAPSEASDAGDHIIAPEVVAVLFEYFDGVNWQSTWNGSAYAADGQTPLGPPAAIRITLTIRSRGSLRTRDYRRTVALPAGNNFLSQQLGL